MSRSRRKPIFKDGYKKPSKRILKQAANATVRNSKELAKGSYYKKVSESWDICDYIFDCRWDDISNLTPKEKAKRIRK